MITRDDIELKKELRLARAAGIDVHDPLPKLENRQFPPRTPKKRGRKPGSKTIKERQKAVIPRGVTVRQISQMIGICNVCVGDWIREGLLPAYQESGVYIIEKGDLKTFLENPPNTVFNAIATADPQEIKKLIGEDLSLKSFNYEYTAKFLGVHKSTIQKWVRDRGLQVKNHMISVEALKEFLRSDYITRILPNAARPSNRLKLSGVEIKPLVLSSEDND